MKHSYDGLNHTAPLETWRVLGEKKEEAIILLCNLAWMSTYKGNANQKSSRNRPSLCSRPANEKTYNPPVMLESQDSQLCSQRFHQCAQIPPKAPAIPLSCGQFERYKRKYFCVMSHSSSIILHNSGGTCMRPRRGHLSPSADPLPRTILMWHYVRTGRQSCRY